MIRSMSMRRAKLLILHCPNCGGKRPMTLAPEKHFGSCDECHLLIECPASPRRWLVSRRNVITYIIGIANVAASLFQKPVPAPAPVALALKLSDTLVLTDHFEVKEIS